MITHKEIYRLLGELESPRVERTTSTTKTDKFGEAICAFANDLPNEKLPGYLIIGADDNGTFIECKTCLQSIMCLEKQLLVLLIMIER